ncbi:hypothetical protein LMG32289_06414 [Cupriavidus pampae]|uniref:Uncharacterized protein n=1 Tax=Cupriavidus pampae TaxID=659251 RepID=A0ABN7ZQT2_9BURK|nr:hypothetical protein LMG32289_06414 [Cupriavidus pampae]
MGLPGDYYKSTSIGRDQKSPRNPGLFSSYGTRIDPAFIDTLFAYFSAPQLVHIAVANVGDSEQCQQNRDQNRRANSTIEECDEFHGLGPHELHINDRTRCGCGNRREARTRKHRWEPDHHAADDAKTRNACAYSIWRPMSSRSILSSRRTWTPTTTARAAGLTARHAQWPDYGQARPLAGRQRYTKARRSWHAFQPFWIPKKTPVCAGVREEWLGFRPVYIAAREGWRHQEPALAKVVPPMSII